MIQIQHLSYRYDRGGRFVLRDISVEITEGTYLSIIGPNGCGKTTLVKHLNGLLSPSEGEVFVDGMNTRDLRSLKEIRQKVGMVFQNPDNQIVGMSVEEDVAFGPGNLKLPPPEIRRRVKTCLEIVGMGPHAKRAPHTLSNGEKQLVAIAGVLAMDPKYIALDEPTAFLDPLGRKRVLEVIGRLNKKGITILHATHNMDEAVRAHQVLVMKEGEILLHECPERVFSESKRLNEIGLDIPGITQLMWRLKEMGAAVSPHVFTIDEACSEISSLITTKAS
jgi:energy-coupling factor transporter ATPase